MASAATTPHPPALVTTTTRLPRGRGWVAKEAATSKPCSTVAARDTPAWRAAPSNTRSSLASAPVWLAAARWPPLVAPPLTTTTGLCSATPRSRSMKLRPSPTLSM
jgi:hypothetical protein